MILRVFQGDTPTPSALTPRVVPCIPNFCRDMHFLPTAWPPSQAIPHHQKFDVWFLLGTGEAYQQYGDQHPKATIQSVILDVDPVAAPEVTEMGWLCSWSKRHCRDKIGWAGSCMPILPSSWDQFAWGMGGSTHWNVVHYAELSHDCCTHLCRFLYMLFMVIDANFCLKNQSVSNYLQDPGLGISWAYMLPREDYESYILSRAKDKDVSSYGFFQFLASH